MQNIETAQRGIVGGIRIELEWYDENELDIERLFNELSVREDVDAVIGPFYSEHTWVAARQCAKLLWFIIPLVLITCTIVRLVSFFNDIV